MNMLERARLAAEKAELRFNQAADALENAAEETTDEELEALNTEFDAAEGERAAKKTDLARAEKIAEARAAVAGGVIPEVKVTKEERTYRPDNGNGQSFFADLVRANKFGDSAARARLDRNQAELRTAGIVAEERDLTAASAGVGFVPPTYLPEYEFDLPRQGRKFADVLPKGPFPASGTSILTPRVTGGTSVASATENGGISETDATTDQVTTNIALIAGQQDMSRVAYERTMPGLDVVLFRDLIAAYDVKLDAQLISSAGTNFSHLGIANVSSINTVTYDDASPTGGELLGKIYDGVQKVASTRFMEADMILMHPRRAAWLAATQSSSFPIFQQGGLFHAAGTQNKGFAGTLAGLPVVTDPNVPTNLGASTNQDTVYVLYSGDLVLLEDQVVQATYEEVLSGNGGVRIQVRGYSYFMSARGPKAICAIDGTGLVTPTF